MIRNHELRTERHGFTLIETLAALGIVSVLIGLLLPAVGAARESARRAQCASHLRQIGIAIHSYHDTSNCFPSTITTDLRRQYLGLYSVHARLLPYLELTVIYNAINFMVSTVPPETMGVPTLEGQATWLAINSTSSHTSISLFLCPSDGGPWAPYGTNYRGNSGVGPSSMLLPEFPDSGNGVFPELDTISTARIPDGLSHTVAFSERLVGSADVHRPAVTRDIFQLPFPVYTADQLLQGCMVARWSEPSANGFAYSGHWWFWAGRERTSYNHAQVPNGRVSDCAFGGILPLRDLATARSQHPGGVNALMADGSLRFVAQAIDLAVWRGLGTRNGGELVD